MAATGGIASIFIGVVMIQGIVTWLSLPVLVVMKLIGRTVNVHQGLFALCYSSMGLMLSGFWIGLFSGLALGVHLDWGKNWNGVFSLAGAFGMIPVAGKVAVFLEDEGKDKQ